MGAWDWGYSVSLEREASGQDGTVPRPAPQAPVVCFRCVISAILSRP